MMSKDLKNYVGSLLEASLKAKNRRLKATPALQYSDF